MRRSTSAQRSMRVASFERMRELLAIDRHLIANAGGNQLVTQLGKLRRRDGSSRLRAAIRSL